MSALVPVAFEPGRQTAWVAAGTTVLSAARSAGVVLNAPCGGRGVCGGCCIKVLEGTLQPPNDTERAGLARAGAGVRLACHARVSGPVRVRPIVAAQVVVASSSGAETPAYAGVDLGTTGVSAVVVSARDGGEIGSSSVANAQASWGADVLSRISAAIGGESAPLQEAAWSSVSAALKAAGAPAGGVERLAISGNTAMAALLSGADLSTLAAAPYEAPYIEPDISLTAEERGLLAPGGSALLVPPISSFVGGDVLAGIAATGLIGAHDVALLVDMGTNAEVALVAHGGVTVASAPAGPAFEGGGIRCGGPARPGAVSRVVVGDDGTVDLETLAGAAPTWFSGAGLVSAVAELRRAGHVRADGLLVEQGRMSDRFFVDDAGVTCVRLGATRDALVISQLDVRAFQLAKAAVRVAIEGVVAETRVKLAGVNRALVAGAFGAALEMRDLVDLGVVPRALQDVLVPVGNTSLAGAVSFASDFSLFDQAIEAATRAEHVDLATDPQFNDRLMAALELERFG